MKHSTLGSSRQKNGDILITSGGRLTIEDTSEFAQLIQAGLAEAQAVAIEFDPDLVADITVLQVLCSACKTAASWGKTFLCHGAIPKALVDLVAAAGTERHGRCKQNNDGLCPWFGGGK